MIALYNGCYCTEFKVHPSNWNTAGASTANDWYIWYRFYDPTVTDVAGKVKPKLCIAKNMNKFKKLAERREATKALLQEELSHLKNEGYNPITKEYMIIPEEQEYEIDPNTPFIKALWTCLDKLECVKHTKEDIKSTIKYCEPAAIQLRYDRIPVKDIRRKHIKALLKRLATTKETWTNNTFNAYRKNLSILFEELIEFDATEVNPVLGIKKKKHAVQKKKLLTPEECRQIDEFVAEYDYNFWRLIHIFFHSGSRTTELFRVQGQHIDLKNQVVKYLVLKGENYEWIDRPIKDVALPLWQELMKNCGPKDYVFSVGLVPGATAISSKQANRRWARHIQGKRMGKKEKAMTPASWIKPKLHINCTWYGLKYLNTTQTIEWLKNKNRQLEESRKLAARQNGHKSTAMVIKFYDVDAQEREQEEAKQVNNKFA